MNKIKRTSTDKVNGKLVKYRQGDCLSIDCKNGMYLGILISDKYNKYYDFTLIEFYKNTKPQLADFVNGKFFGTRFGSWEEFLQYAVTIKMINCKYVDSKTDIEKVGELALTTTFKPDGHSYINDIDELLAFYLEELPIRIEKSRNAEKFPALAFVSKHLVEMKFIIAG